MHAILKRIRQFLNRPYPYYFEGRVFWILVLLIGSMAIVFEFVFKPFHVNPNEHRLPHFLITVVHTFVALSILIAASFILKWARIRSESWTVGKDILLLGTILLAIGIGQFLIRDLIYNNPNNWSMGYLLEEIRNTFLIGMLFVLILVPINQNRQYHRNSSRASGLQNHTVKAINLPTLSIQTQLKQDDFDLDPSTLLFAKAERNYVEFHLLKDGQKYNVLKRMSLRSLEQQLQSISHIVKTHRSYLVNLQFLESVSGNAQGYLLNMRHLDVPILVSRTLIPTFEKRLRQVS